MLRIFTVFVCLAFNSPILAQDYQWTQWFDRDSAGGSGDWELLKYIKSENPNAFTCDMPQHVECQTTSGLPASETGEVTSCSINGFYCRNTDQVDNRCEDYKIRFLCPSTESLFTEVAEVGDTPPCPVASSFSGAYSQVDNCFNLVNPPPPSIVRTIASANESRNQPDFQYEREIDRLTSTTPWGDDTRDNATKILTSNSSTNDGRLWFTTKYKELLMFAFRPENLNYDLHQTSASEQATEANSISGIYHLFYQNPVESSLNYALPGWKQPIVLHSTICEDSGSAVNTPASRRNPRSCAATAENGNLLKGDCYDVSLVTFQQDDKEQLRQISNPPPPVRREIVSADVTIFVEQAKMETASVIRNPGNGRIWVYPRMTQDVLPKYSTINAEAAQVNNGTGNYYYDTAAQCYASSTGDLGYCAFQDHQYRSPTEITVQNFTQGDTLWDMTSCNADDPSTYCGNWFMFEPTISADGRLLLLNMDGYFYSYNDVGACRADGWTHFKPLSEMPFDPAVNTRYDIAKTLKQCTENQCVVQPFRDTKGDPIPRGSKIPGAYGWIDRTAKNFFFAALNEARDGYHAVSQNPAPTDLHGGSLRGDFNPDLRAGKGYVALGAWTRGKMVHLDNSLNLSDFGGRFIPQPPVESMVIDYDMQLYQGPPTKIAPRSATSIFSFENQLNYFDAMNPHLPFDVVWTISANNQHNAEIAFDEYINKNAFIVAHMNAPFMLDPEGHWHLDDGFLALHPEQRVRTSDYPKNGAEDPYAGFHFARTPRLQNAVTNRFDTTPDNPPVYLNLRGGARVEPANLGGVLGRGVFLDGYNDHIELHYNSDYRRDEWYLSAWLDSREEDNEKLRTVFYFADDSWIGMSRKRIVAYNAKLTSSKEIDISSLGLAKAAYYHFGVKIESTTAATPFGPAEQRILSFYINGTRIQLPISGGSISDYPGSLAWSMICYSGSCGQATGFSMSHTNSYPGTFYLGDPGPYFSSSGYPARRNGFKGWVDEFRAYKLDAEEQGNGNYFDEVICNTALGTLVNLDIAPAHDPRLASLFRKARQHGIGGFGGIVCEQMRLASYPESTDFPPQQAHGICINRVHKNAHPTLGHLCHRKTVLENDAVISAWQPLPSFINTDFCTSCHTADNTLEGLRLGALTAGTKPKYTDPRRRPLEAPAMLNGCMVDHPPFPVALQRCLIGNSYSSDQHIISGGKVQPAD